ncbi:MAG: DUF1499 domain-containing protein, partial [Hyphomicrobiaceae bacterium]|nr:DUF1499 domain-containing protein [Hyphomicrobiaceae bacterium]
MNDRSTIIEAPLARWASRIALFSASLVVVGIVLHRLTTFPTPVALNLFGVGLAGCGLALLVGLIALVQIWRRGFAGAGKAALGVLLPLMLMAWPLTFLPALLNLPPINDVTTDVASPPQFVALAKVRAGDANPAPYPGERFAQEQQKAYPDLRTFWLDRGVEEAYGLVEEAVRKLKWRVASSEPPGKQARSGTLEATDLTPVIGFPDDVVVRVEGNDIRARVDVRSASRYGPTDFGQNAFRVRRFLAELQARVDS